MLDYFVAIGAGLLGLLVVFLMFRSISRSEVVAVVVPAKARRSRSRKAPKASHRNDTALDRETEVLIAREVARQTATMRTDVRIVRPALLEDVSRKAPAGRSTSAAVAEKPMHIDKMGFQTVAKNTKPRGNPSLPQASQQLTADEEMSRKLGQFFSNNRREKKGFRLNLKEEQAATSTGNGVHVVVKKDISHARSWQS